MKRILTRIAPLILILLAFSVNDTMAQAYKPRPFKKVKTKETKVKEPRAVVKARKEQEKNQKKLKKQEKKAIADGKKRHFQIQPASVKERMKQNEKDIALREKSRQKNIRKASRAAAKKYKQ
jgi:hypothetical protein